MIRPKLLSLCTLLFTASTYAMIPEQETSSPKTDHQIIDLLNQRNCIPQYAKIIKHPHDLYAALLIFKKHGFTIETMKHGQSRLFVIGNGNHRPNS